MALTESTMLNLGTKAPDFSLIDVVDQRPKSFAEVKGEQGTLVVFICNHCPYVIHVIDELVRVANDYAAKGIGTVHISSNDVEKYPVDSPDHMQGFAESNGFTFPYLYDENQEVARAYDAACTPDIYLFDHNDELYYRGRLDANRPGTGKEPDGAELRAAIEGMLSGQKAPAKQYPSAGCNIKWKQPFQAFPMTTKIGLEDVRIYGPHGFYEEEHRAGNEFSIDAEVESNDDDEDFGDAAAGGEGLDLKAMYADEEGEWDDEVKYPNNL